MKEAYPIELAEYVVANRLVEEPAFKWWVPGVLKKRNRIISYQTRYENEHGRSDDHQCHEHA